MKSSIITKIAYSFFLLLVLFSFSSLSFANESIELDSNNSIIINQYNLNDDFSVFSIYTELKTCSCGPKVDTIKIYNSGSIPNRYSIITNLDYATVSNPVISLQPKETKDVLIFIDAPCKAMTKTLEITVKSMTGKEKVLSQNLVADFCMSFAVKKDTNFSISDPCKLQIFEFTIFNIAEFKDDYYLETDSFEKYVTFSENPVNVPALSNKKVFMYLEPECSIYGNYSIGVNVGSVKTPLSADVDFISSINRAYDFSFTSTDYIEQCNMEYSEYAITVTNNAKLANYYNIEVIGPNWATLSKERINLTPSESKELKLVLAPILEELVDDNITIKITSEMGDILLEKNIFINVEDCYSFNIVPQYENILLTCSDDNRIYFDVENIGIRKNTYNLKLDTVYEGTASLDDNILTLNPNSTKRVYVNLNLSDDISKENIVLNVEGFSNDFNYSENQKLKIITTQECYGTTSNIASKYVFNRSNNFILVNFTNNGIKKGFYNLTIPGFDWIGLEFNKIAINAAESKEVLISFNPDDNNISDGKYYPNLIIAYDDKFYSEDDFKVKIRNQTFWQKIVSYFTRSSKEIVVEEEIVEEVVEIPILESQETLECDDVYSKDFCDVSNIELVINSSITINLTDYFKDSNQTFSHYEIGNNVSLIGIELSGEIVNLTSYENVSGNVEIEFLGVGDDIVLSKFIMVDLVDKPKSSRNYVFELVGILVLIILLIVWIVLSLYNKDKSKKEKISLSDVSYIDVQKKEAKNKPNSKKSNKSKTAKKNR